MRSFANLSCVALSALLLSSTAQAAKLTRGPYQQMSSDTAVTIVWRSDEPTKAKVEYAESASDGSYDKKVESDALATQ